MMRLKIDHVTRYRYAYPVQFRTHRLILRPLEGHDVQITSSQLEIHPAHQLRWIHDVFDNSIALVEFSEQSETLLVHSQVVVEHYNTNPFNFLLDPSCDRLPMQYSSEEEPDVRPYRNLQFPHDQEVVRQWIRPFLDANGSAKTLDCLVAMNRAVSRFFQYERREAPGVQSPHETIRRRSGSCRDYAVLLMEAGRELGIASRFVSGYLGEPTDTEYSRAGGATHAWAEFYLPGAGWKGFDPSCGILASDRHVRTAVAREPAQAAPVSGSFIGPTDAFQSMEVDVRIEHQ